MKATQIYIAMAQYNRWMDEKLLVASALFSDVERKQHRGVPFNSLHGLWNHLLLTNRIWLARFDSTPYQFNSLTDELYSDFDELRQEITLTDTRIEEFANSLTEERMNSRLEYARASDSARQDMAFWVTVQHFFNHQTHHRGQITALIEQMGGDCGVTDLVAFPLIRGL
jgi:uncharacterized damage-inducible protein DinB